MTMPYRGDPPAALFVTRREDPSDVLKHFEKALLIEVSSVGIAKDRRRTFRIYALDGYRIDR